MTLIKIDIEQLKEALEHRYEDSGFYLDIQTGEIIFIVNDDFADNEKIKNELLISINGRKPFRRFKDTLQKYPKIEDKYYDFYDKTLEEKAKEWISLKNLKVTYK